MPRVVVGFGSYERHEVSELPAAELDALAIRYPLRLSTEDRADYQDLVITIAVHAEVQRRAAGGKPIKRVPSLRELAEEIVTKGYQQASKQYHPDGKGTHDAQLRLTHARDQLREAATNLQHDYNEDDVIITRPPAARPASPVPSPFDSGISDDDVPF